MRIPGVATRRQVQSLGRRDIGGPMRVANAQAAAARYEGAGLQALGRATQDIAAHLQRVEDQLAVDEYNEQWLLAQAEANDALGVVSQPLMDASMPGMESLQFKREQTIPAPGGGTTQVTREKVRTYEVGGQWLANRMDAIRDAAMDNLGDSRSRKRFAAQWALHSSRLSAQTAASLAEARRADLTGGYQLRKREYIQRGDETGALAQAAQALASGLIDGTQYAKDVESIQAGIDEEYFAQAFARAESEAEIEALSDMTEANVIMMPDGSMRRGRLTPDQRYALRNRAEAKLKELDQDLSRRQREGAKQAMVLYSKGQLTVGKAAALVESGDLSPAAGRAWVKQLKADAKKGSAGKLKSDPAVLNYLQGTAGNFRTLKEGQSAQEWADSHHRFIELNRVGLSVDGETPLPNGPTLTGADAERLHRQVDAGLKRITDNPQIKDALRYAKAELKVPPAGSFFNESPGVVASLRAYNVIERELKEHMDTAGPDADPKAFVDSILPAARPSAFKPGEQASEMGLPGQTMADFLKARPEIASRIPDGVEVAPESVDAAIGQYIEDTGDAAGADIIRDQLYGLDEPIDVVEAQEPLPEPQPEEQEQPSWLDRQIESVTSFFGDKPAPKESKAAPANANML